MDIILARMLVVGEQPPPPPPMMQPGNKSSFKQFKLHGPPSFASSPDRTKAEEWVWSLERVFKMIGCPNAQKATFAECSIDGDARIWWELTEQIYAAKDKQITWEDFKREFFDQYVPSVVKDHKATKFLHLKQRKMAVAE